MIFYESPARMMAKSSNPGMSAQDSVYGIEIMANRRRESKLSYRHRASTATSNEGDGQMKVYLTEYNDIVALLDTPCPTGALASSSQLNET
jgi:hypothetical protein